MELHLPDRKQKTKLPQVLRAALKLFVQQGIEATTIKDIAKEAGVAEGALYRHYKSKTDLAWDLFRTNLNRFTAHLDATVLSLETAEQRVRRLVEESFLAYESDPELYTYLILREHAELAEYPDNERYPGDVVLQIIGEGQAAGDIKTGDPYVLGSLVIGGLLRVGVVKMHGTLRKHLTDYSGLVADNLWAMLSAKQARSAINGVQQ